MALNTSPSFGTGQMAQQQMAGQRAAQRRATPMGGGGMGMPRPNVSKAGQAATARRSMPNAGGSGIGPSPFQNFGYKATPVNPMSFGYNPGGGMGKFGNSMPSPEPVQAPPLMAADAPPVGDGMVAGNAPNAFAQPDMGDAMSRLRSRMGGNTGITGRMGGQGSNMFQMY